jgi:hypothetical protein
LESQQHQRRNNGKTSYIEKRRRRNILAQIPLLLLLSLVYFEANISRIEEKKERRAKGTEEIQSGLCSGFVLRSVKRRQLSVNI